LHQQDQNPSTALAGLRAMDLWHFVQVISECIAHPSSHKSESVVWVIVRITPTGRVDSA